ncbi:unnamed protein product, partial [marine sediment metagenome]
TDLQYCNLMYLAASVIIEELSGMSYNDFIVKKIFKPLKMKDSGLTIQTIRQMPNYATPYKIDYKDEELGYIECARVFTELSFLGIIEPFLPFVGTILLGGIGILFLRRIWNRRDEMKAEYGDLAYQKMFPTGVVGISLLGTFIIHAFTSIRSLPPGAPVNPVTTLWSQSILPMIGLPSEIDIVIRLVST